MTCRGTRRARGYCGTTSTSRATSWLLRCRRSQQIADRGTCDGAEGADQKKIFAYISQLARSVQGRWSQFSHVIVWFFQVTTTRQVRLKIRFHIVVSDPLNGYFFYWKIMSDSYPLVFTIYDQSLTNRSVLWCPHCVMLQSNLEHRKIAEVTIGYGKADLVWNRISNISIQYEQILDGWLVERVTLVVVLAFLPKKFEKVAPKWWIQVDRNLTWFSNRKKYPLSGSETTIWNLQMIFCLAVSAVWVVITLIRGRDTWTLITKINFIWTFLHSAVAEIPKHCSHAFAFSGPSEPPSETFST